MLREINHTARSIWDSLRTQPLLTAAGTAIGLLFPVEPVVAWSMMTLIMADTLTGYQAAVIRGEEVRSGIMFRKAAQKLKGYASFLIMMGLAGLATSTPYLARGAIGLVGAIEAFSVLENLYDMQVTTIDPRKIAFFDLLFKSANIRRRNRQKPGDIVEN